jgi:hypothetical protein
LFVAGWDVVDLVCRVALVGVVKESSSAIVKMWVVFLRATVACDRDVLVNGA